MLFDKAIHELITRHWEEFGHINARPKNLWHESWDQPLGAFIRSKAEAETAQTPQAWRILTVQGRALRTAMSAVDDGTEHPLFISITKVTDTAESGLESVQKGGREIYSEELARLVIRRLEIVEKLATDERAGRSVFEANLKKELNEIKEKVSAAKAKLIDVTVKLENSTFAIFSTGVAEVANLIRVALSMVDKYNVVDKIKAAGRQVYEATGRFLSDLRDRIGALNLPWSKSAAESYFEPSPDIVLRVRRGEEDGEELRIPGDAKPFTDWFMFEGKRINAPELVVVPAGNFDMGSTPEQISALKKAFPSVNAKWFDAEGPLRRGVTIPAPFAIGRFAVTRWQFAAFQRATNHKMHGGAWGWDGDRYKHDPMKSWQAPGFEQADTHPVVCVSYEDATRYCVWLTKRTGKYYRLPSEAEWEYVCRAGTKSMFWWGDEISTEQANINGEYAFGRGSKGIYRKATLPVQSFDANSWGLWQVHGNVYEWCQDNWHHSYSGAPADSSTWSNGDNSLRVLRGGSWYDVPQSARGAFRGKDQTAFRSSWCGFRVARTIDIAPSRDQLSPLADPRNFGHIA